MDNILIRNDWIAKMDNIKCTITNSIQDRRNVPIQHVANILNLVSNFNNEPI